MPILFDEVTAAFLMNESDCGWPDITGGGSGPSGDGMLLENSDYTLLETGDFILLE